MTASTPSDGTSAQRTTWPQWPIAYLEPHPWQARRRALIVAGSVAVAIAAFGFPLGLLWSHVAPRVPVLMTDQGAVLAQPEGEQLISGEAAYLGLTIGAGVLAAALVWGLLRQLRGVISLVGLAAGTIACGLITYWFGHLQGLARFKHLIDHAPIGTAFHAPVNLRAKQLGLWQHWLPYAKGDVFAMAIAALVTYLLLTGFSTDPQLRTRPPDS